MNVWYGNGRERPLIPAQERQKQADLGELSASLVYIVSSRPSELHRKTVSKTDLQKTLLKILIKKKNLSIDMN